MQKLTVTSLAVKTASSRRFGKFLSTTALAAAGLAMIASGSARADNWADHTYESGSVTVDTSVANTTNLHQTTHFVKARGDGDINAGWTVNIAQPSSSSKYVLYDIENDPTYIRGTLNANGEIYIFDRNGVIFGENSVVNVGAIIASTGFIADSDLLDNDGKFTFLDVGTDGRIELHGAINVADAGLAAFVSPVVQNSGIIRARLGKVAFAAGDKVTLDLYGDNLVEIAVSDKLAGALLENTGEIYADGGVVSLTAQAAKEAVDNVINMSGIIDVSSVETIGGKIVLRGGNEGKVEVSGTLNASGAAGGGDIAVTGHDIEFVEGSFVLADAIDNGDGGNVFVYADNNTLFEGSVYARGGEQGGNGGFVEISSGNELGYDGSVNTLAPNGLAGSFLLDPRFAVIHSGSLHNPIGLEYVLSAKALANDLARNGSVTVQADEHINVGTDFILLGNDDINLADYDYDRFELTGYKKVCVIGICTNVPQYGWVNYSGITAGDIVLDSDVVNFNKNLTIGTGNLSVLANTINLDGRLYGYEDGSIVVLDDSRLDTTATVLAVISNKALIQQGIDFVGEGATVNVGADTYTENLVIGKALKLSGDDAVLQAAASGNLITVTADDVNIDPFVFDGAGIAAYGIYADGADDLVIDGNTFLNFTEDAIHLVASNGAVITGNTIYDIANNGIYVVDSGDVAISENDISNTGLDGIRVERGSAADIWSNNIGSTGGDGISVSDNDWLEIWGNEINDVAGSGIKVLGGNEAGIRWNFISGASGYGISVGDIQDATINNNDILSAGKDGIYAWNNDQIAIEGNKVYGASGGYGINNGRFYNAVITGNQILGADHAGIFADGYNDDDRGYSILVSGNTTMLTGGAGIQIGYTDDVVIEGNTVYLSGNQGIDVYNGGFVSIVDNDVLSTGGHGISVSDSGYADITGNLVLMAGLNGEGGSADANGIDVRGVYGYNNGAGEWVYRDGPYALVESNVVIGARDSGIAVSGSATSEILNNLVLGTGGHGIFVNDGDYTLISGNVIAATGLGAVLPAFGGGEDFSTMGDDDDDDEYAYIGGDGIRVENSGVTVIADNLIAGTIGNGIGVFGGNFVRISDNQIALAGGDGIHVESVSGGGGFKAELYVEDDDDDDDDDDYHYGYGNAVEIEGNQIVLVGGDGIEVDSSGRTAIVGNSIFAAGIGFYDLLDGDQEFTFDIYPVFADDVLSIAGQIGFEWGDGDGIKVSNIYGGSYYGDVKYSLYSEDYGKDVLISGNDVAWTGGHGISVENAGTVSIAGNTVERTGIDETIWDIDFTISPDTISSILSGIGSMISGISGTGDLSDDILSVAGSVKSVIGQYNIAQALHSIVPVPTNTFDQSTHDGIHASNIGSLGVYGNEIENAGDDGIEVQYSPYAKIAFNTISETGGHGINLGSSDYSKIFKNEITNAGTHGGFYFWPYGDGIHVENSAGSLIMGNRISDTAAHGIYLSGSPDSTISRNRLSDIGSTFSDDYYDYYYGYYYSQPSGDGIHVENSNSVNISKNDIDNTAGHGIYLGNSPDSLIYRNNVSNSGWNRSGYDNYYYYDILGDGIHVQSSADTKVKKNDVYNALRHGIAAFNSEYVSISGNDVDNSGKGYYSYYYGNILGDGIHVESSYSANIKRNDVSNSSQNGIYVIYSDLARITGNDLYYNGFGPYGNSSGYGNGIYAYHGQNMLVAGNVIDYSGSNGIYAYYTNGISIDGNQISNSNYNGVYLEHIYGDVGVGEVEPSVYTMDGGTAYNATVTGNTITDSGNNGIYAYQVQRLLVEGNDISNSGSYYSDGSGIRTYNYGYYDYYGRNALIDIIGNSIDNSARNGINVEYQDYYYYYYYGYGYGRSFETNILNNLVSNSGTGYYGYGNGDGIRVTTNTYSGSYYYYSNDTDVLINVIGNEVENSGTNGIYVQMQNYNYNYYDYYDTASNARMTANILDNLVDNSGNQYGYGWGDGINVYAYTYSDYYYGYGNNDSTDILVNIAGNDINNSAENGIETNYYGYNYYSGGNNRYELNITDNNIDHSGWYYNYGDGIRVNAQAYGGGYYDYNYEGDTNTYINIARNDISDSASSGIDLYYYGYNYGNGNNNLVASILNNDIRNSGSYYNNADGIRFYAYTDGNYYGGTNNILLDIIGNDVSDSAGNGIYVGLFGGYGDDRSFEANILNNRIDNSGFGLAGYKAKIMVEDDDDDDDDDDDYHDHRYYGDGIHVEVASYSDYGYSDVEINIVGNDISDSADDGIDVSVRVPGSYYGDYYMTSMMVEDGGNGESIDFKLNISENEIDNSGDDGITVSVGTEDYEYGYDSYLAFTDDDDDDDDDDDYHYGYRHAPGRFGILIAENTVSDSLGDGIEVSSSFYGEGEADVTTIVTENIVSDSGENGLYISGPDHGLVVVSGNTFRNNTTGARFESGLVNLALDRNSIIGGVDGMVFDLAGNPDPLALRIDGNTLGNTLFRGQSRYYIQLVDRALFQPGKPTVINALNVSFGGLVPAATNGILTLDQFNRLEAKIYHYLDLKSLGLIFFGTTARVNQEDIFRGVDPFAAIKAAPSVTVLGLPSIFGTETALNALAPAAGGEDDEENRNPNELAALEPAAGGGDQVACWGDAIEGANSGQQVSFNFGSSQEEILAASASCRSNF